jgi:Flp pilus assembly protein TadG
MIRRRAAQRADADRGSVSLLFVVLAVGLLAMAGLVVDGGGKARAAAQADDVAQAAARAGVQALSPVAVLDGVSPAANPALAASAARAYLDAAGVSGTVSIAPGGRTLSVTTADTYHPILLSAIGIGALPVTGQATADLVTIEGAP